jgi:hypothetical protein
MSLLKYESQIREPLVDGTKITPGNRRHYRPIEMKPTSFGISVFISVCACYYLVLQCITGGNVWYWQWNLNKTMDGVGISPTLYGGRYWSRGTLISAIFCFSARAGEQA